MPVPETLIVPSGLDVTVWIVGASGVVASGEDTPAALTSVAVTSPVGCGATEVTGPKVPSAATSASPVVPSGNVTVAVAPG